MHAAGRKYLYYPDLGPITLYRTRLYRSLFPWGRMHRLAGAAEWLASCANECRTARQTALGIGHLRKIPSSSRSAASCMHIRPVQYCSSYYRYRYGMQ